MNQLSTIRANLIMLALLIVCAISVVTSQNKARKYFTQLQTETDTERKLDQEWRELQIESQTQSTGKRIEQKAMTRLGMLLPEAKKTVIVVIDKTANANSNANANINGESK